MGRDFKINFENFLHSGATLATLTDTGIYSSFHGKGVSDLHRLYGYGALSHREIADRVTGIGAAVLMIAGGVRLWQTGVISKDAADLLASHHIPGHARITVPHIINRSGTGRCPLECRLAPLVASHHIDSMLAEIDIFVKSLANMSAHTCQ